MSMPLRIEELARPEPVVELRISRARRRRGPDRAGRAVLICALLALGWVVFAVGSARGSAGDSTAPLAIAPFSPGSGTLALNGLHVERRLGFVSVAGSVRNRAAHPIPRVTAVVELLDASDRVVQTDSALVAFDPLPAGEAAPFKVECSDAKEAVKLRVRFQELGGALLN